MKNMNLDNMFKEFAATAKQSETKKAPAPVAAEEQEVAPVEQQAPEAEA